MSNVTKKIWEVEKFLDPRIRMLLHSVPHTFAAQQVAVHFWCPSSLVYDTLLSLALEHQKVLSLCYDFISRTPWAILWNYAAFVMVPRWEKKSKALRVNLEPENLRVPGSAYLCKGFAYFLHSAWTSCPVMREPSGVQLDMLVEQPNGVVWLVFSPKPGSTKLSRRPHHHPMVRSNIILIRLNEDLRSSGHFYDNVFFLHQCLCKCLALKFYLEKEHPYFRVQNLFPVLTIDKQIASHFLIIRNKTV